MDNLTDFIHESYSPEWAERCQAVFDGFFGQGNRYPESARKVIEKRVPGFQGDSGVPFGALIHPSNPDSGPYGGMSFVLCPIPDGPSLVAMIAGTQGLSPDEEILSRPGHARKVAAICSWLNERYAQGRLCAWAKQDPVRTDLDIPDTVAKAFTGYSDVFAKYGKVVYGLFGPGEDKEATANAAKAFLDLMFSERKQYPLKSAEEDADRIRTEYFSFLMPDLSEESVADLLQRRRYVILEGPPGTGKTRMALRLLKDKYGGNGKSIQLHPNTTYETFIGGLAPVHAEEGLGFRFAPQPGALMQAVEAAEGANDKPYLLHIDEINRADLAKVLGEAIFLLESQSEEHRELDLPYDFGGSFGTKLSLPENLHIVGTMNSADRSIAIVDVAVRRRFAFLALWPQMSVVSRHSGTVMQQAFRELLDIFVEHSPDDAFTLVPGHSYFLENDDARAAQNLRVNLIPLLEEYLAQGYVASFSDAVRSYIQWVDTLD